MVEDVTWQYIPANPVEFFGRTGGVIPTPSEVFDQSKNSGGAE